MAHGIGGLPGGGVNPEGGAIRLPGGATDGSRGITQQTSRAQIPNGSLVEGLVTAKEGDNYQVRIGAQLMNARSSVSLSVGQRFRATWDSSTSPPTLHLQSAEMSVLAKFSGRDRQIAVALLTRGLPVKDDVVWGLRQQWMQNGGDPGKLGVLVELWARGVAMTEANVELFSWYMGLSPETTLAIWRKIRERLRSRKFGSPKELLQEIRGDGDDVKRFLAAHALAGKAGRKGIDPASLLAPAWWPVDDGAGETLMARVALATEKLDNRSVWWFSFSVDGETLGAVFGDVMTNSKALSVSLKLENPGKLPYVEKHLSELKRDLEETTLFVQHIGVGVHRPDSFDLPSSRSLDMEA